MDYYYECKKCLYRCKQQSDMKKHLNKIKKCEKKLEAYKYDSNDLYSLSLVKNYVVNNNEPIDTDNLSNKCSKCNKEFATKSNLNRHVKSYCKFIDNNDNNLNNEEIINDNNEVTNNYNNKQNITNINNNCVINNNITNTINIQVINSFEQPWSTDHLNFTDKYIILGNDYRYTKALEKILENDKNLNVLMDTSTDIGYVYKNNKITPMAKKELTRRILGKIKDNLYNFGEEINTEDGINIEFINNNLKEVNKKFEDYLYNKNDIQDIVKNLFAEIYEAKRGKTINILTSLIEDNKQKGF